MNKLLLFGGIALGILTVLAIGVWVFLFFGSSNPGVTVAPTPFATGEDVIIPSGSRTEETSEEVTQTERKVSQISTRSVAGAVLVEEESGAVVRFAERGTGHLYEISLGDGTERRITNTTFARTTGAVWSPNGTRVVLEIQGDNGIEEFLGSINKSDSGEGALTGKNLPAGARNIAFGGAAGDEVYFSVSTVAGTTGYKEDLKTGTRSILFSIPLSAVVIDWNPTPLITTKATAGLVGYAYNSSLSRKAGGTPGFLAEGGPDGLLLTTGIETQSVVSRIRNTTTSLSLNQDVIPEKCTFTETGDELICAVPREISANDFPDKWYRGEVSYDDTFYSFDTASGRATLLANPRATAGRSVDAIDLNVDQGGDYIIFRNKTDYSLWLVRR